MKKTTTIYWSFITEYDENRDWDILMFPLESVFNRLKKDLSKNQSNSYFKCPAMTSEMKNTFVVVNPIESRYKIENNQIKPISNSFMFPRMDREPTLTNQMLFKIPLTLIFFSEEDSLPLKITAPYFEHAPHLQYGAVVTGSFDIAKWFRNINIEFQTWKDVKEFKLGFEEPITYLNFNTDKQVVLKRFTFTDRLNKLNASFTSSAGWEPRKPLSWRYMRFEKSKIKQVILQEIKKNLVED